MKKYMQRWKKGFAGALAICVMTVSVPHTAWAGTVEETYLQEEYVTLQYDAGELSRAVWEAVGNGESLSEEWSWNTDSGAALADKYQELFETGSVREVTAEYEGELPDGADVRVFVKGEKVIFLLTNDSEADRVFRLSVGNAATPEIVVAGKSEIVDLDELEKDEIEIKDDQKTEQPDTDDGGEEPIATGSEAEKEHGNQAGGEVNGGDSSEAGQDQSGQMTEGQDQSGESQGGQKPEGQDQGGQKPEDQGQGGQKPEGQGQSGQNQSGKDQKSDDGKLESLDKSGLNIEAEDADDQGQDGQDFDEKEERSPENNREQSDDAEDESSLLSISRNQVPMVTVSEQLAMEGKQTADDEKNPKKNAETLNADKKETGKEVEEDDIEEDGSLLENDDAKELTPDIEDSEDIGDSTASTHITVLEGRLYGAFVSDEGSRGRAFVTTLSRIEGLANKETTQSKAGTLKLYHILNAEGQVYYEAQEIALTEDDFDESGSYHYEAQVFQNRTGLLAVTSEAAMTVNRTQFSEEAGMEQQAAIEYRVLEGYQIADQEKSASPSEADSMSVYFRSAGSGAAAREGFPTIVPLNSTLVEVADHTQYVFSNETADAQDGVIRYTVSDGAVFTMANASGSSGTGSSVVVGKDVTDLTLVLGSAGQDLTLDASATDYAGLLVEAGANATLVLVDGRTAVIKGGYDRAGVELEGPVKVQDLTSDGRAQVTIRGEGTLKAYGRRNKSGQSDNGGGAGIGGRGYRANGELVIESGTIIAFGAGGGAGIGGGGSGTAGENGEAEFGTEPYERRVDYSGGIITIHGGSVTASGENSGSGAGIGGGNHGDGGRITIDGTAYVNAQGGSGGAGIGAGKGSHQWDRINGVRKNGPGYFHGGEITIDGAAEVTATGGWNSAGIGGGYCGDSGKIVIAGGTVTACGTGGNDAAKNHGGAGIGGGYEGHGDILIIGGTVTALAESSGTAYNGAAGIGSGATPNAAAERGDNGGSKGTNRGEEASLTKTSVVIQGGVIEARGGIVGGAGIGTGFAADICEITIENGDVTAYGGGDYPQNGGAGIGSARYDTGIKYNCETNVENISITGGTVTATGAWGAAGIGSGASNVRAGQIVIGDAADVVAYADGTKFAVDTFDRTKSEAEPDRFIDHTGARMLQGTFMDLSGQKDEAEDYTALQVNIYRDLAPASGESAVVSGKLVRSLNGLPRRYRSFAVSVDRDGDYLVKAGKTNPDESLFCYDTAAARETAGNGMGNQTLHYQTTENTVGDHFWLYQAKNVTEDQKPDEGENNNGNNNGNDNGNSENNNGNNSNGSTDSGDNDSGNNNTGNNSNGGSSSTGNTGGGGPGTVTIEDSPVPLASLPADPSPKLYLIDDEDVPLAALPKTGDRGNGPVKFLFLGSILAGVYLALSGKRKDEI